MASNEKMTMPFLQEVTRILKEFATSTRDDYHRAKADKNSSEGYKGFTFGYSEGMRMTLTVLMDYLEAYEQDPKDYGLDFDLDKFMNEFPESAKPS